MPPTPTPTPTPIDDESCSRRDSCGKKKKKKKSKLKLSGFFQAQLRKLKSKGKLSSNKQGTMPRKLKSKDKLSSNKSVDKQGTMPWINYQITSSSSTCQISKIQQMTLFDNHSPILRKHRRRIHDLPDELLAEILKLLPVKYILRCRCVQKSWYYLIQSPTFITLHLNYQKKKNNHPKYLYFENAYTDVLTLRFDDVQCQQYCTLTNLPGLPEHAWRALSYGLICVSTMPWPIRLATPKIYLWNPLVQKYKTLPDSPLPFTDTKWKALAFGFVPEINDYVVVQIVNPRLQPHPHSVIIGVYSLNTNSWKMLSQDNVFVRTINLSDAVFINSAAFWVGVSLDRRKIVMCFDTKTNILREISLPNWVTHTPINPVIHLSGHSIAYFVWDDKYDYFDMWILKYDSINDFSWEKKMSISPNKDIRVEVLGVRNNGEPILARSYNLISYNLDNHEAHDFVDSWDSWTPYRYYEEGFAPPFFISPFVESLVLLNID